MARHVLVQILLLAVCQPMLLLTAVNGKAEVQRDTFLVIERTQQRWTVQEAAAVCKRYGATLPRLRSRLFHHWMLLDIFAAGLRDEGEQQTAFLDAGWVEGPSSLLQWGDGSTVGEYQPWATLPNVSLASHPSGVLLLVPRMNDPTEDDGRWVRVDEAATATVVVCHGLGAVRDSNIYAPSRWVRDIRCEAGPHTLTRTRQYCERENGTILFPYDAEVTNDIIGHMKAIPCRRMFIGVHSVVNQGSVEFRWGDARGITLWRDTEGCLRHHMSHCLAGREVNAASRWMVLDAATGEWVGVPIRKPPFEADCACCLTRGPTSARLREAPPMWPVDRYGYVEGLHPSLSQGILWRSADTANVITSSFLWHAEMHVLQVFTSTRKAYSTSVVSMDVLYDARTSVIEPLQHVLWVRTGVKVCEGNQSAISCQTMLAESLHFYPVSTIGRLIPDYSGMMTALWHEPHRRSMIRPTYYLVAFLRAALMQLSLSPRGWAGVQGRVLVIGLGGNGIPLILRQLFPIDVAITVVEIEPQVLALCRVAGVSSEGDGIEYVIDDGARHLAEAGNATHGMIIFNAYDAANGIFVDGTALRDAYRALADGGLLVVNGFVSDLPQLVAVCGSLSLGLFLGLQEQRFYVCTKSPRFWGTRDQEWANLISEFERAGPPRDGTKSIDLPRVLTRSRRLMERLRAVAPEFLERVFHPDGMIGANVTWVQSGNETKKVPLLVWTTIN